MIGVAQLSTAGVRRDLADHVSMMEWQLTELRGKLAKTAECHSAAPRSAETMVRSIIKARRKRDEAFEDGLFADPAWDILLELYASALGQHRMSVSSVCAASAVPATTALRWIDKLDQISLITREQDALDGRRVWVTLTERGMQSMHSYIEECCSGGFSL